MLSTGKPGGVGSARPDTMGHVGHGGKWRRAGNRCLFQTAQKPCSFCLEQLLKVPESPGRADVLRVKQQDGARFRGSRFIYPDT